MYYFYILFSRRDKNLYYGSTPDLKKRMKEHDLGLSKSTKNRRPLFLVYYEAYLSKNDARKREHEVKRGGQQREILKKRLKYSLRIVNKK